LRKILEIQDPANKVNFITLFYQFYLYICTSFELS